MSGYLNRQLNFLCQGVEFHKELSDPTNIGILLPHNRAEGRTKLDGTIVRKSESTKLIRVKSIAVSDKKYVCPDHLSRTIFPPEETSGAFGLRTSTSLTESFTQSGLSLKHSGSFVQVPVQNQLMAFDDTKGTAKVNRDLGILSIRDKDGNILVEYHLPSKFDILNPEVTGKGDHIGTTLATASAGLPLDIMIKVMNAKKAMPDEGLSKNIIRLSNNYSPVGGVINYDFEAGTYTIGSFDMGKLDKDAVYYYPQGSMVNKFDRIQSNPIDPSWYFNHGVPVDDVYFMFRKEFKALAGDDLTEELLEVLFHVLIKKDFKSGKHEYLGTSKGVTKGNSSFFAQLSFERGKAAISRLSSGELKFENDIFTRNILDHLIISAKDKSQIV